MAIKSYSTTAASNTALFPENQLPSTVNDGVRQIQADIRAWYEDMEWRDWGHTVTRASATTFTVATDVTAIYMTRRPIRCTDSSTLYGYVVSSSYSAPNTTVTVLLDSGSLSVSLSAVSLGPDPTKRFLDIGSIRSSIQTLTDAATISWDTSSGSVAKVTLGGNRTLAAPTNLTSGGRYVLHVIQDSTGGRTLSFNSIFKNVDGAIPNPAGGATATTTYVFESPDGTNLQLIAPRPIPRTHFSGLTLSTAGSSPTISVAPGQAADSTNSVLMNIASTINKTTSSWAVGSSNGGLDTGSIAINTFYYFYQIMRPDTGVVDVIFSTNASTPTLPTNYTYYRYIGSWITDGSSNWLQLIQQGDYVQFYVPPALDFNDNNPGSSAVLKTLSVPKRNGIIAVLNVGIDSAGSDDVYGIVTDPAIADTAPSRTTSPLANLSLVNRTTKNGNQIQLSVRTNSSGQIRYRLNTSNANITVYGVPVGWYDRRDRDI